MRYQRRESVDQRAQRQLPTRSRSNDKVCRLCVDGAGRHAAEPDRELSNAVSFIIISCWKKKERLRLLLHSCANARRACSAALLSISFRQSLPNSGGQKYVLEKLLNKITSSCTLCISVVVRFESDNAALTQTHNVTNAVLASLSWNGELKQSDILYAL